MYPIRRVPRSRPSSHGAHHGTQGSLIDGHDPSSSSRACGSATVLGVTTLRVDEVGHGDDCNEGHAKLGGRHDGGLGSHGGAIHGYTAMLWQPQKHGELKLQRERGGLLGG
jgi:hypothetical protein